MQVGYLPAALVNVVLSEQVNGFRESKNRILELEKENKKYELTVKQLESLHSKDSEYNGEMERQVAQSKTQVQRLEQVVSTMKEAESRLRIEKDTEIDNLSKQVNGLRKRQEQGQNEQIDYLEKENTRLVKVSLEQFCVYCSIVFNVIS